MDTGVLISLMVFVTLALVVGRSAYKWHKRRR